jgi:MFS-type transporter involved in bile tolerance (Atg22 family)
MVGRNKYKLLFCYWLISETVTVISLFFAIYATTELKLSTTVIGLAILGMQMIALPSTIYSTKKLVPRRGERKAMVVFVSLWFVAVIALTIGIGMRGLVIAITL